MSVLLGNAVCHSCAFMVLHLNSDIILGCFQEKIESCGSLSPLYKFLISQAACDHFNCQVKSERLLSQFYGCHVFAFHNCDSCHKNMDLSDIKIDEKS